MATTEVPPIITVPNIRANSTTPFISGHPAWSMVDITGGVTTASQPRNVTAAEVMNKNYPMNSLR
ncbi:hypothetical protein [Sphingomonas sp. SUN039]|uniref:hypothetical protein n=1 Tax=Sphingomonas sp. SUN039 TaxID=2937787 RepID=UPI0021641AEF|nr:hypothetical protein [Sphingomonas sp. SUN039]UVO55648.1 hypothetical protein M0209_16555 [Sphingomonas sp. SUN039]